jgi:hypothetical protein
MSTCEELQKHERARRRACLPIYFHCMITACMKMWAIPCSDTQRAKWFYFVELLEVPKSGTQEPKK